MLSPVDVAVIGVAALLLFGPDQLPKVARKVGAVMRDVQNTSQTFIREMEKAAEIEHPFSPSAWEDSIRHEAPESAAALHEPVEPRGAVEPFAHDPSTNGTAKAFQAEPPPAPVDGAGDAAPAIVAGAGDAAPQEAEPANQESGPGEGAEPGRVTEPVRGADFSI